MGRQPQKSFPFMVTGWLLVAPQENPTSVSWLNDLNEQVEDYVLKPYHVLHTIGETGEHSVAPGATAWKG